MLRLDFRCESAPWQSSSCSSSASKIVAGLACGRRKALEPPGDFDNSAVEVEEQR